MKGIKNFNITIYGGYTYKGKLGGVNFITEL